MTRRVGTRAFQTPAARDMNLQLDKIEPSGALRHRVFHLQTRIHLHEREHAALRLVQEFYGAGVTIVRRLAQPDGCFAQCLILLRSERRRRRFLDDLLVTALDGAIAHAGGPGCSVLVGDDLDLYVARAEHQLLHENSWIAEGLERFSTGALKGFREVARRMHSPNPVTAASSRGFDQQRIAQPLRMAPGVLECFHRPAAPRRHNDSGLLGQTFRGDLVAQPPDDITIRTDEHDSQVAAQIREFGVLGHETPSHPDSIRARGHQGLFQPAIVDITALRLMGFRVNDMRFAKVHCLVRFAHEHRMAVRIGEKSDGRERRRVLLIEFTGGVDEAHCGFSAVHNRDALEFAVHKAHTWAACSSFSGSASTPLNSDTVR